MQQPPALKIFVEYDEHDLLRVGELYEALAKAGFHVFWAEKALSDLPLGTSRSEVLLSGLKESEVVLVCIGEHFDRDDRPRRSVQEAVLEGKRLIPVYLSEDAGNDYLGDFVGVNLWQPDGLTHLVNGLQQFANHVRSTRPEVHSASDVMPLATMPASSLKIGRIALTNVRCFESFDLALADDHGESASLTVVLGDNAAGKSTLLRSIALGLASESEASALIKQLPGSFVRRGMEEGVIRLDLQDPESHQELSITTRIYTNGSTDERIRKEIEPDPFPWQDLFVCAYGTNRSRQAAASYETYTLHQAVLSLFEDDAVLQNPEVVLLRQDPHLRAELERRLLRILMLDDSSYEVTYPRTGPEIQGPWGDQPLRVLSDGYRSTAQWVLDFLSWSIYAGRFSNGGDIGGILLVDELEQHLHPLWQRHVVQRLHQLFPQTQIFASTHTPLAASGTADIEASRLLRLRTGDDGSITSVEIDPHSLAGMRADQVLASEAFGLHTTRNPGSEDDVSRYAELLGKASRTDEEEVEMKRLAAALEASLRPGESEAEREVEQSVEAALKARVSSVKPELLDLEARRQLHELFAGDESD